MTTQTVELDPETGLALLPEGYIWRVTSAGRWLSLYLIRINTVTSIRYKWIFFGREEYIQKTETEISDEYLDTHQFIPARRTKENISERLSTLSKNMYTEWKSKQDQSEFLKTFTGDYPPKNLNSL